MLLKAFTILVVVCGFGLNGCKGSAEDSSAVVHPIAAPNGSAVLPISSKFFGLTVLNTQSMPPTLHFGTTRTWDASPAMNWAETNSQPGQYNFRSVDQFFALNKDRDIIFTLGRTPRWASSLPDAKGPYGSGQCAAPRDLASWDAYVEAVAKYVNGRTHYWEIWNEPDGDQFYCGDISTMVAMAQHAHAILKRVDPLALVLSPPITGGPGPKWLDSFLMAGGGASVDIIAFHGYSTATAEDIESVVASYQAVVQKYQQGSKPMWDTEVSWAGNGNLQAPDDAARAAYIPELYLLHLSQGIQRVVWYAYDASPKDGGLRSSKPAMSPAEKAYEQTYLWLQGATLTAPCSKDDAGTWSCGLERGKSYKGVVLWNSTRTLSLSTDSVFKQYRDLEGSAHVLSGAKVVVNSAPILLETATPLMQ
jgi:hypothetical protein